MTIRLRLALVLVATIAAAGAVLLAWTAHAQRASAIAQARDFALGLSQITLAGLTGMMIVGAADRRSIFLDQIEQANDIRGLRVIRAKPVEDQFGPGRVAERPADAFESQVLATGQALFEVRSDAGKEYLRAVMPALASRNFLGKDCIACHAVAEGTVLGAVALDIDLTRVNAAIASFRQQVAAAGMVLLLALGFLAYLVAARTVSAPLVRLAASLDSIARGRVDLGNRLGNGGSDEIAGAAQAFDRVLEKAQLMVNEERISADVFEHALNCIVVTDAKARIIKVNPSFTAVTGYAPQEVIGQNPRILKSGRQDEAFYQKFWEALLTAGKWQGDIWNKRKSGELYAERLNISCVRDEHGQIQNYVAIFSDITERKRREATMTHQAQHDGLTGLPNRLLFRDRVAQALALARRGQYPLAVMFLDLDKFKQVNDTYGHNAGDELLRQVALRIRGAVREADTVARLSGDEFTVLLPQVQDADAALAVADKILEASTEPYLLGERVVHRVTTSVGVALFPLHGDDADTLMQKADQAMYRVKRLGRAGRALYDKAQTRISA